MERVVIVGGGFGGVSVARQLARRTSRDRVEIVLIEEQDAHVYTPWLYEVATAISPVRSEGFVRRARRRATIPFKHFPGFKHIRIVHGKVSDIARDGSHVVLKDGTTLAADIIVIAVGSLTNDFGIPGVKSYASPLKTAQEAEHIAREFRRVCTEVHEHRVEHATIAVVGAGANGVELVAEIAAARNAFLRMLGSDPTRVRLVLCDAALEPVNMFHQSVRKHVAKRLKKLGVEFFGKTSVKEVVPGEIHAEHLTLSFDLLLWSAGVKSRTEPQEVWGLPVNERGRIRTSDTFQVEGRKKMFALGDSAARSEKPDPQSAQVASVQALTVAKNIKALLEGRSLVSFKKSSWQTLLAVGGSYGVGRIFGIPLRGKLAFWIRRLVDLKYFLSVFPVHCAIMLWYRGVEAYGENDDPRP